MEHLVKICLNSPVYVEIRRLNPPKTEVLPSTIAIKKYSSLTYRSGSRLYTILAERLTPKSLE